MKLPAIHALVSNNPPHWQFRPKRHGQIRQQEIGRLRPRPVAVKAAYGL